MVCLNKLWCVCLSGLQFVQASYNLFERVVTGNFFHVSPGLRIVILLQNV